MGAYTDDIDAAKAQAIEFFETHALDTQIIENAYDAYTGVYGIASYYGEEASQLDTYLTGDTSDPGYAKWQVGKFWAALAYTYSDEYGVSDSVSAFLDAAAHSSTPEMQTLNQVTPKLVKEAVEDTAADIKKATKIGISALPLGIAFGVALWISK